MATQRQARAAAGVGRILAKLKLNIDSGNFYEAHQLYRTLYFRYFLKNSFSSTFLGHSVVQWIILTLSCSLTKQSNF